MSIKWINVRVPNQTADELLREKMELWASLELHKLRARSINRHDIEQQVRSMPADQQDLAKECLNKYQAIKRR